MDLRKEELWENLIESKSDWLKAIELLEVLVEESVQAEETVLSTYRGGT